MVRRNVRRREASFEEVMQIEIEEWTRELPRIVGPHMERDILV